MTATKKAKPADETGVVELNVDALERDDAPEPLPVKIADRVFRLRDPLDMSIADMQAGGGHIMAVLVAAVEPASRDAFVAAVAELSTWRITKVLNAYNKHFGLSESSDDSSDSK